ncbi:MAG: signal peptide peptidase SppA [Methanomicrobiales archaeon]|nr:signal peptide peptidase SppA [Methanomicrobiales archaeon]
MGFLEDQIRRTERREAWEKVRTVVVLLIVAAVVVIAIATLFTYTEETSVAVVYVEGELYTGDFFGDGGTGSEYAGRMIRQAADNPLVEAIVIRVDSPGGSPAAAQEIITDIEYAKQKKPVVVSMGDMATSAAYAISAHADRIYANPDSLTAGIGTIWTFTDISRWLENEGLNVTVVKSGTRKDMASPYRPITGDEISYAQDIVDASAERLITDVAAARNISRSLFDDGRVLRGEDAVRYGLVDELGNLNTAIEGARNLAAHPA